MSQGGEAQSEGLRIKEVGSPEAASEWQEGAGGLAQHQRAETPSPQRTRQTNPSPRPSEQVLHLWLEVLCSSLPTVEKWYQPWSFLRSPGWVQIKCELR